MLLREIKHIYHLELDTLYGKEEVSHFFYLALEHYLGFQRFILSVQPNIALSKQEEQPLFATLAALKLEKPIQYILGTAHFMDLELKVNSHVLIPRPETEDLVRWIIQEIGSIKYDTLTSDDKTNNSEFRIQNSEFNILDIGTGSGCIAIALAKALPGATISAMDVSMKALEVAKYNSEKHGAKIQFRGADILQNPEMGKFDIIVSNPPYVRESEKIAMKPNVKDYEPGEALFVPDQDSLRFHRAIAEFAVKNLYLGGMLFLEINQYLALETQKLLQDIEFRNIELRKDLFGKDRMLMGFNSS
ncbi:MAG: peptide chain release factor N(5)-glutamine methyltransferase [Bacteroidota bacterium]